MDPGVEHQPPIAEQRVARGHGRELVAVGPGDEDHLRRQVVALPQPKLPLAADLQQRLAANDQALAMRDPEGQAGQLAGHADHPPQDPRDHQQDRRVRRRHGGLDLGRRRPAAHASRARLPAEPSR